MLGEVDGQNDQRDRDVEDESEREVIVQYWAEPVELVEQPVEEESIWNNESEGRNKQQH